LHNGVFFHSRSPKAPAVFFQCHRTGSVPGKRLRLVRCEEPVSLIQNRYGRATRCQRISPAARSLKRAGDGLNGERLLAMRMVVRFADRLIYLVRKISSRHSHAPELQRAELCVCFRRCCQNHASSAINPCSVPRRPSELIAHMGGLRVRVVSQAQPCSGSRRP